MGELLLAIKVTWFHICITSKQKQKIFCAHFWKSSAAPMNFLDRHWLPVISVNEKQTTGQFLSFQNNGNKSIYLKRLVTEADWWKTLLRNLFRNFKNIKSKSPRSSHRKCSVKKGFLRNSAKFTRKHLWQSLFFNKVADLRAATLLKKESDTGVFLWILQNF